MSLCISPNLANNKVGSRARQYYKEPSNQSELVRESLYSFKQAGSHLNQSRKMIGLTSRAAKPIKARRVSDKHRLADGSFSILVILVCFFIIANIRCDQVGSSNGKF